MSGKGKVSGFKLPYKLYGDVSVFHGEIIDSLDEFQSEVGVSTDYQKFIPKNIGGGKFNLIDLDLGVNIVRRLESSIVLQSYILMEELDFLVNQNLLILLVN